MDSICILVGSDARVKIMRLFLFHPETNFDIDMVSLRSQVSRKIAIKECAILEKAGLIKRKVFYKTIAKKVRGLHTESKKKSNGFCLNQSFHYLSALKNLLINKKTLEHQTIIKRISKAGVLKLLIISGVFIQNIDSRVDMLIVGNSVNKTSLSNIVKSLEAELGKELVYAYFETSDFEYRRSMYDKLIRDVMESTHQVLVDKLSIQ